MVVATPRVQEVCNGHAEAEIKPFGPAAIGVARSPSVSGREGRLAAHELPPNYARADTLFIRRRDAYPTSAVAAFLAIARPSPLER